jgi:hypothetical protein
MAAKDALIAGVTGRIRWMICKQLISEEHKVDLLI